MKNIRRCLDVFCTASGGKVSLTKSKLFISSNVSCDMANQLEIKPRFLPWDAYSSSEALRKLPIRTYSRKQTLDLLDGDARLSMARRITMVKFVLESFP
ncbi:hypothetical protein V2J09_006721 [Rumex salicifolius]